MPILYRGDGACERVAKRETGHIIRCARVLSGLVLHRPAHAVGRLLRGASVKIQECVHKEGSFEAAEGGVLGKSAECGRIPGYEAMRGTCVGSAGSGGVCVELRGLNKHGARIHGVAHDCVVIRRRAEVDLPVDRVGVGVTVRDAVHLLIALSALKEGKHPGVIGCAPECEAEPVCICIVQLCRCALQLDHSDKCIFHRSASVRAFCHTANTVTLTFNKNRKSLVVCFVSVEGSRVVLKVDSLKGVRARVVLDKAQHVLR